MPRPHGPAARDRALRQIRLWSGAAAVGAAGLTGAVAAVTAGSFSTAVPDVSARPPRVPQESRPVQSAPPTPVVIIKVVHSALSSGGSLRPPASGPAAAAPARGQAAPPPPPPAPACHSTPSRPC